MSIRKVWKDPVWSAVIASIIVVLCSLIYDIVLNDGKFKGLLKKIATFWNQRLPLWFISTLSLSILIVSYAVLLFAKKKYVFVYSKRKFAADKSLYQRIKADLHTSSLMDWVGELNFCVPTQIDNIFKLDGFLQDNDKPDFYFFHPRLEKLRKQFIENAETFLEEFRGSMFSTKTGGHCLPYEWKNLDDGEYYSHALRKLEAKQDKLSEAYGGLIKEAKKIFSE